MKKTYKYINKMGDTFEIQNGQKVRVLDDKEHIIQWCEVERGEVCIHNMYLWTKTIRSGFRSYHLDELRESGYDIDEVRD